MCVTSDRICEQAGHAKVLTISCSFITVGSVLNESFMHTHASCMAYYMQLGLLVSSPVEPSLYDKQSLRRFSLLCESIMVMTEMHARATRNRV